MSYSAARAEWSRPRWESLSLAEMRARGTRLFGATLPQTDVALSPSPQPTPSEKDSSTSKTARHGGGEQKGDEGCRCVTSGTTRHHLERLFSPERVLSSGDVSLDRALLAGSHAAAVAVGGGASGAVRTARFEAGEAACGGLQAGRLYELYGPPLCGKTTFAQRLVAAHARHMVAVHGLATSTTNASPVCASSASPVPSLTLHPGSWDVVVCVSAPASTSSFVSATTQGTRAADAVLADWAEGFFQQLAPPASRAHPPRKASLADLSGAHDGDEGRCDVQLVRACVAHVHLVPISEPNALLDCLDALYASLIAPSESVPSRPVCAQPPSTWTHTSPPHSVLVVVDSLEALWRHASLQNASRLAHATHWYAAELHRRLRCCLALDLAAAPLSAASPAFHLTCFTVNGCMYYDHQRIGQLQQSAEQNQWSTLHATLPRPLGGTCWQQAVDCRLLLEPVAVSIVGLVVAPQGHRRVGDEREAEPCAADASPPETHRKRQRHHHHLPDGDDARGTSSRVVCCTVVNGRRGEVGVRCTVTTGGNES